MGAGASLVFFAVAGAALAAAGCWIETDHCGPGGCHDGLGTVGGSAGSAGGGSGVVATARIDTDQTMVTDAATGAGVFVEYGKGGVWHVFTSCDTALSKEACVFNVVVTLPAGTSYSDVQPEGLEPTDGIYRYADGLELAVATSTDFDGVRFTTPAGTTARFEVYLGGKADGRYLYWIGDGAIHPGAPTNPIDLKPSTP
jgi:hypothetical protein